MKKTTQLKIVNLLLCIAFIVQMGSGMFHSQIPREVFHSLHEWGARALLLMVIIHVVYNFGWIKSSFLKKQR